MKRFAKSMHGVTLLEIMLVLAIAAMIIVMSVRYYQSATSSQQANSILQQIQAITAAADGLAQASGSYTSASVSNSSLSPLLPANGLVSPWGGAINVTGATATSYNVNIAGVPAGVCPLLVSKLAANNHYSDMSPATAAGCPSATVSYTYRSNP